MSNTSNLPETILIVDDNEDDIFALKRVLKKANILNPHHVAKHGHEAFDYLSGPGAFADRQKYPLPCIVFLDLQLPLMNGFEILSWVGQQPELADIVVVVLSGSDEVKDHQRAYALGARSYLVKPPTAEDLTRLIDSLRSHWLKSRDSSPFVVATR